MAEIFQVSHALDVLSIVIVVILREYMEIEVDSKISKMLRYRVLPPRVDGYTP